jgi:hypothetical protein
MRTERWGLRWRMGFGAWFEGGERSLTLHYFSCDRFKQYLSFDQCNDDMPAHLMSRSCAICAEIVSPLPLQH